MNIQMAKKNAQSPDSASGNSNQHQASPIPLFIHRISEIISSEFLVECISSEQHHLGHYLGIVSVIKWKGITPFMKQAPVK